MRMSLEAPVKIVMIGAGGTGGYILPHLYRIAGTSGRKLPAGGAGKGHQALYAALHAHAGCGTHPGWFDGH